MPEATKKKIFSHSFKVFLILIILIPILAYQYFVREFADAGYIRCGRFYPHSDVAKSNRIIPSRAWVLDAADCVKAEAYPPSMQ